MEKQRGLMLHLNNLYNLLNLTMQCRYMLNNAVPKELSEGGKDCAFTNHMNIKIVASTE